MLFNSFSYILLFLPFTVLFTWAVRKTAGVQAAQAVVLACSLFFYSFPKPSNLPFLFGSILVNWLLGRRLAAVPGEAGKRVLQIGLILNVAFLGLFKYTRLPELETPLGVSFFTIAQIMYLVNCYEGAVAPGTLFDHATFVSFFPYVISGPISRAKRIVPQFRNLGGASAEETARGMYLFAMGLFKKVVFADAFSVAADYGFAAGSGVSLVEAWLFATFYALRIYFDFSGYSDMAIGSGLILGIHLPPNFDSPFESRSIIEFWQRWHISLTGFITNYLYTPMVRAFPKRTWVVTSCATVLAMTIAGLWHGANWTFLIFGTIHGLALAVNQNWRVRKMPRVPGLFSWLITMMTVDLAFVFFHAASLRDAAAHLPQLIDIHHIFGLATVRLMNGLGLMAPIFALAQITGLAVAFAGTGSEARARSFCPSYRNLAGTAALTAFAWIFLNSHVAKPFVYFGF